MKVRDLTYYDKHDVRIVDNVSFNLRAGEILGVAGVEGCGQKETSEIIAGLLKAHGGKVEILGVDTTEATVAEIRKLGLSHIHEDRMLYGVAMEESIEENMISIRSDDREFGNTLFLNKKTISEYAQKLVKRFSVFCNRHLYR